MADTPSQSNQPGFSEALLTCLREDALVRADAAQLKAKLEEARAAATQTREGTALPGRLLAALGRRKGSPSTPEEAAEVFARETVLRRQYEESERVMQSYTLELDTQLAVWLRAAVPVYAAQATARVRLTAWAGLISDLQVDLRELSKALGQARNNAVAGYDRSTHKISATALELFDRANGLIGKVESRVRLANDKAAELGGLPGVAMIPLRETFQSLIKLEIAMMQLESDRLARELENFAQKQLVDLQVPAVQAADAQVAQARAYLEQYREQLRAHYDQQVQPADLAEAIPVILDRFRRR
jgi:small-conductance mechanosensitive channel